MRITLLLIVLGLSISGGPARAGLLERHDAHTKIGYARAAVKACPKLAINPDGIFEIISKLDAADQAAVAADESLTKLQANEAASMFKMLGKRACDAALLYERKLGIDLFTEK